MSPSYTLVRIKRVNIHKMLCLEQYLTLDKRSVNVGYCPLSIVHLRI